MVALTYIHIHIYIYVHVGVAKIGVPQNRWSILEIPTKMVDLGVPLFQETSIYLCM